MKASDKFESIACKRDDKARRVSNVAPDTIANVTADTLENGITLEALESLNVPVLRYAGQVTIHGRLPEFNQDARPGGYKAVFLNGNGSVGVRYIAIDAEKKLLIQRACRAAGPWAANLCSSAFEVSRSFYVRDEEKRDAVKQETLAALRSLPVALFYGQAFAFTLAWGAGYGCGADVGAIPSENVWPLIKELTGLSSLAEIEAIEQAKEAAWNKRVADSEAAREKEYADKQAAFALVWAAMLPGLRQATVAPLSGEVILKRDTFYSRHLLETVKGKLCSTCLENTELNYAPNSARKLCKDGFPWPKALAAGNVYIPATPSR